MRIDACGGIWNEPHGFPNVKDGQLLTPISDDRHHCVESVDDAASVFEHQSPSRCEASADMQQVWHRSRFRSERTKVKGRATDELRDHLRFAIRLWRSQHFLRKRNSGYGCVTTEDSEVVWHRATARQQAHRIAARLDAMGLDPYQSALSRFLVLLGDAPGEIVDLGRPLRSSRLFKTTVQRRDIEIAHDFEKFAAQVDRDEWLFWNVGLPTQKAEVGHLVEANVEFNRLINIHFSELRKRCDFELLLLVIHPRWDEVSRKFDLHAHFICRIPPEHREPAKRRLLQAFSKADVASNVPVKNAAACATYMVWGICPSENVAMMPNDALADLWALSRSRARLVRPGGAFKHYRRLKAAEAQPTDEERNGEARIKANREETADSRACSTWADRLLAKIIVQREGKAVPALLFEEAPIAVTPATAPDYSSATGFIIQEAQDVPESPSVQTAEKTKDDTTTGPLKPRRVPIWRRICCEVGKNVRNAIAVVRPRIEAATATLRDLLGRFISVDPPS